MSEIMAETNGGGSGGVGGGGGGGAIVTALETSTAVTITSNRAVDSKKPSYVQLSCKMSGYTDLNNYELKSRNGLTIHQMTTVSKMNGITTDTIDGCVNKTVVSFKKNSGSTAVGDRGIDNSLSPSFVSEIKNENEKSFVEQRIERLYGRGLLLEEFHRFKRRSSSSSSSSSPASVVHHKDNLTLKSPVSENNFAGAVSPPPALPVFKHLSPEFRAQLAVHKDRKPRNALLEKDSNIIANGNGFVNGAINGCRKSTVKTIATINGNNSSNKMSKEPAKSANEPVPIVPPASTTTATTANSEKGPHFFLALVESEAERLLKMAAEYENYLNDPEQAALMSEETSGFIRTTAGQAKLLTSEKFKQFRELCEIQLSERKPGELPLKANDLVGFWDMVDLQVAQIDSHFNRLHAIKKNNWIYLEDSEKKKNGENGKAKKAAKTATKKVPAAKSLPSTTSVSSSSTATTSTSAAAAENEARKKNLEEQRQQFRAYRQKAKAAIVNSPEKRTL